MIIKTLTPTHLFWVSKEAGESWGSLGRAMNPLRCLRIITTLALASTRPLQLSKEETASWKCLERKADLLQCPNALLYHCPSSTSSLKPLVSFGVFSISRVASPSSFSSGLFLLGVMVGRGACRSFSTFCFMSSSWKTWKEPVNTRLRQKNRGEEEKESREFEVFAIREFCICGCLHLHLWRSPVIML